MAILSWFKTLTRRRFDDDDFQDEIGAHLAIAAREKVAGGADPKAAHQASVRDFGNVTLTREAAHHVWTPRWVDALHDIITDVRYAIRALAKNPAFSLTVVGVLTLGIGLNAAVFTMLKGMALSPLVGVDGSARLSTVFAETGAGRPVRLSYPDYQYLRDHDQAFSGLYASIQRINSSLIFLRLAAMMLSIFGVAGMALAAMGTYGLVSYTVKQSTHEIGIRMALGASGPVVVRGFLWRGVRPGVLGAALGIVAALGVSRLLGSVLYGVSPTDAISFARALAVVLAGVAAATVIPAWRASRTDPLIALRHQ